MRKQIAFLVIFLLIFVSSAGCIHIYKFEDLFVPQKEEEIEYQYVDYHFNHTFWSTSNNPIEVYSEEFTIPVKPQTENMRFDIDIIMQSGKELWETINETWPGDIPDWLQDIIEQFLEVAQQRYIEITIKSPEGEEWFNYKFNDSKNMQFPAETPLVGPGEGNWIIEVDAAGGGLGTQELGYQDSFSIVVVIREPKEE